MSTNEAMLLDTTDLLIYRKAQTCANRSASHFEA